MLIPTDLPLIGVPSIKHEISKNPLGWIYPWSPAIFLDIPEEIDPSKAPEMLFLLSHELNHIHQMRIYKPLTLLLWHVIKSSYYAPAICRFGKKECDLVNRITTAWAPFLEADAVLDYLISNITNSNLESLIKDLEHDENGVVIDGLSLILNIKRSDFAWKSLYKLVCEKREDISDLLVELRTAANVLPFIDTPFEVIEQDWESSCFRIATDSIKRLGSFLSYSPEHSERQRMRKSIYDLNDKTKASWMNLFKNLFVEERDNFLNFLLAQIINTNFPMRIPVLFPDGQIEIFQLARGGKVCVLEQRHKMWKSGTLWVINLISLEIARSLSDSDEMLACPLFKVNAGSGYEYFCGKAKPSLEWCTFYAADKVGSMIDISYRSKYCPFWDILKYKIHRQLEEFMKKSRIAMKWGNKLFFERSKGFVFYHFEKDIEEVDLSVNNPLRKEDLREFIEGLPEQYLTLNWKKKIVEELESNDFRWISIGGRDSSDKKIERTESKEEFLAYMVEMLKRSKIVNIRQS